MTARLLLLAVAIAAAACRTMPVADTRARPDAGAAGDRHATFANPLNLSYRFVVESLPVHRTAADPLITLFGHDYYLFASKSGGYWHSPDLRDWTFVVPTGFDLEPPAPAILVLDGRMYYTAHRSKALYTTGDPRTGRWTKVADLADYPDPAFLLDDDGRVYLYHGASLNGGISVVELDPRDGFKVIAGPTLLMRANHADHGWERSGPDNLGAVMAEGFRIAPYIEAAWMTKHDGTYYLQYSAPGTVWKTYADGVYTSTSPTSGFTYAPYSPFSYKPGGFIGSGGHAATFRDKRGNYWRVVTMIVSVAHKFERRLGLVPAGFDADGVMRADNYLGDYPQYLPGTIATPLGGNRTGWMLVSAGKQATASSTLDAHPAANAFDEDVRTWWSAASGARGEWLSVDLGQPARIEAVQINFAEQDARARGRSEPHHQQYVVERSDDGTRWSMLIDRSRNIADVPHDYVVLDSAVRARYVRITNVHTPASGRFSIRDLRVFGLGDGAPPAEVRGVTVQRDTADTRTAIVRWSPSAGATAYVVRFGVAPDKLYTEIQVDDVTSLRTNALNRGVRYYFTVDAISAAGVARGTAALATEHAPAGALRQAAPGPVGGR